MSTSRTSTDAYATLEERITPIINLSGVESILRWDQQVKMPEGGTPARSRQLATVSRLRHDLLSDEEIDTLLATLSDVELPTDEAAVVREIRRQHERAAQVPSDLIEEIRQTSAEAHSIWETAREEDDFDHFAPILEEIIDQQRDYAEYIDPEADPYAVLFADYEPYMSLETAEGVLESLRDALVPLIDSIHRADADLATDALAGEFDPATQEELCREVLGQLGYDWTRGRLDTSTHPFSTGTQFDARVTTRFAEDDLLGALTSSIHEFGHAHYTLGLPEAAYGTPLGEPRSYTVHESQSRLWENHVGRSEPFWSLLLPLVQDQFPVLSAVDPREAYEAANRVYTDNLIRVEADELTYHLHIVIRFEIERALISGDLAVRDIPDTWNDKYESYLGVRPDSDAEGCLQDVHWSGGMFGYFPTYSLGSVLAAQLFAAAERDIGDLASPIRDGRFDALSGWLRENIHSHGQRYTTPDLVEHATGEPYTVEHFLEYARQKYGDLYGV